MAGRSAPAEKVECPLYPLGEFGIYFRDSVRACIDVKSSLTEDRLKKGVDLLVESRRMGPGPGSRYILFAYDSKLTAQEVLDKINNTELFFDNRPHLIVVLGCFVVVVEDFEPQKPRPSFSLTAFRPKAASPDLTLLELIDTIMDLDACTPIAKLHEEIQCHFEKAATRRFVCPVERPGAGAGTNLG